MIQVYSSDNTNYEQNGNMTLIPESAKIKVNLGGSWSASLSHPLDSEGRWRYLEKEAVVKMPSFNGEQLFRIRSIKKDDYNVDCELDPIFFDCRNDEFIRKLKIKNKTAQQALNLLCTGKYSAVTNIADTSSTSLADVNLLEALFGTDDTSFINRWGGEPVFDNYQLIMNARAGADRNVEIRYGKNIPENGMSVEEDLTNVVTRIYPEAYNGHKMSGDGYVDSPNRNAYAIAYTKKVVYEDVKMWIDATQEDETENPDIIVCNNQQELDDALSAKCNADFQAGADKPELTIEVNMILLQNTEQYADVSALETVSLGDTVHCNNSHLGITTDARVVELVYDAVRNRVESVTLGSFKDTYFDTLEKNLQVVNKIDTKLANITNGDGSVIAEKIKGLIDGAVTKLKAMYDEAQAMDHIAILFENRDATSPSYGALAIGTQGLIISKERDAADTDWIWTTAINAEGVMAGTIAAGTVYGEIIAKNLIMEGGSINLVSDTADRDMIHLQYYFDDEMHHMYDGTVSTIMRPWSLVSKFDQPSGRWVKHARVDIEGYNDLVRCARQDDDGTEYSATLTTRGLTFRNEDGYANYRSNKITLCGNTVLTSNIVIVTPVKKPVSGITAADTSATVKRNGCVVSVDLTVEVTAAVSSLTTLFSGLPTPVQNIRMAAIQHGASYTRPLRIVVIGSDLQVQYGAPGTYYYHFTYITSDAMPA